MYRDMGLEWHTLQALDFRNKNRMLTNIKTFAANDIVYPLVPHTSALQSNAQKFRQDYVGPLAIDTKIDDTARCVVPNLKLLIFYLFYFNFSLRTKNKLGCQLF